MPRITFKSGELTSGIFRLQERDETGAQRTCLGETFKGSSLGSVNTVDTVLPRIKIMHGVMNLTHMTAQEARVGFLSHLRTF